MSKGGRGEKNKRRGRPIKKKRETGTPALGIKKDIYFSPLYI
jgi:hypothetical protein